MTTTTEALTNALAVIRASLGGCATDPQRLMAAKAEGLVTGYHIRWLNEDITPISVEQITQANLFNPDTGKSSRTFRVAGKMDVLVERDGRQLLMDHKTTSEGIADPAAPYWQQLVIEGQVAHYMMTEWLCGRKLDGAIWDVIRKPSISPRKLKKAEQKAVASGFEYFGHQPSEEAKRAVTYGAQPGCEDREPLELYTARLIHDCTHERPEWYFQRRPVPRLDSEILEYARELWSHGQDLIATRAGDRHVRNSGACMRFGRPCEYLGICSGYDTPDSDKWQPKKDIHPELEGQLGGGLDVLTNSRIRCFQTCKKLHYFRYEMGIERADKEEHEALYFGTLLHKALEAWWRTLLPEQEESNCGNSNSSAAQDGGTAASEQTAIAG